MPSPFLTLLCGCGLCLANTLVSAGPPGCLPRNFDVVYPHGDLEVDAIAAHVAPYSVVRPWYLAPYRNYSYYRPWYTYGAYGPIWHRYHYSPSWGYRQPWYGPHYLNPDAIAPPLGEPPTEN
jgi:hypothetical protein